MPRSCPQPLTSRPSTVTLPPEAVSSPMAMRSAVVLPQPDGPMSETISPSCTLKLTRLSACTVCSAPSMRSMNRFEMSCSATSPMRLYSHQPARIIYRCAPTLPCGLFLIMVGRHPLERVSVRCGHRERQTRSAHSPALAGEGWGGGGLARNLRISLPHPNPPPQAGEGTHRVCRAVCASISPEHALTRCAWPLVGFRSIQTNPRHPEHSYQ